MGADRVERLYARLFDEEDARVCKDIPDAACVVVPRNFLRLFASLSLTNLGDALINPKTVLTWLLNALGAPSGLVALLVPIRESGSMLPQLAIAACVRHQRRRKWSYVLGAGLQGVAVAAMAGAALLLDGTAAGLAVVGALVAFSLARGLCSIASKDVIGKTVPKTRRGRLSGYVTMASGLSALVVGLALSRSQSDTFERGGFALLLGAAASLWFAAAGLYSSVSEQPGATSGGANGLKTALLRLGILRDDAVLRRFVCTRACLLGTALAPPFLVALLSAEQPGSTTLLGALVALSGLASTLSAPLWGRFADRSSRTTMRLGGTLAGATGLAFLATWWLVPAEALRSAAAMLAFFVLQIAHAGVRLGRKTYLVDIAGGNRRTDYVSVSNSLIGAILLGLGGAMALAQQVPPEGFIAGLSGLALAGALLARSLPEAQP